ncbi:hypothetical protein GMSM_09340 [Geomonas sp. Red276]
MTSFLCEMAAWAVAVGSRSAQRTSTRADHADRKGHRYRKRPVAERRYRLGVSGMLVIEPVPAIHG